MDLRIKLKMMLWNVENLFLLSDHKFSEDHLKLDEVQWQKLSTSVFYNKPLAKTKALAKIVLEEDPDLILLCEVGGIESLQNFNRLFLSDKYSPVLTEGNSDRNIDIGFLVRKNLGFYFDLVSNKSKSIDYSPPAHRTDIDSTKMNKFTRDAAELHLFLNDRNSPFAIIVLTHLKSQLDRDRIDPLGFERRRAEVKGLVEIVSELQTKYGEQIAVALCGDFNGNASKFNTDEEFQPLYEAHDFLDVCEVAQIPQNERATFFQVGRSPNGNRDGRQIDFCLLSSSLRRYLRSDSVKVYRYKDEMGFPLDPPTSIESKIQLPSDHYPILFCLQDLPVF